MKKKKTTRKILTQSQRGKNEPISRDCLCVKQASRAFSLLHHVRMFSSVCKPSQSWPRLARLQGLHRLASACCRPWHRVHQFLKDSRDPPHLLFVSQDGDTESLELLHLSSPHVPHGQPHLAIEFPQVVCLGLIDLRRTETSRSARRREECVQRPLRLVFPHNQVPRRMPRSLVCLLIVAHRSQGGDETHFPTAQLEDVRNDGLCSLVRHERHRTILGRQKSCRSSRYFHSLDALSHRRLFDLSFSAGATPSL